MKPLPGKLLSDLLLKRLKPSLHKACSHFNPYIPTGLSCIQRLSEVVGSVVQAKEEVWSYAPPKEEIQIATVGVGLDGTCMLIGEDGYREAMMGNVSL